MNSNFAINNNLTHLLSEFDMTSTSQILEKQSTDKQVEGIGTSSQGLVDSGLRKEAIVSIILPVHNESKTIRDTVTRYFQELEGELPFELIVAEDGSVDGTKEVLMALAKELPIVLLSDNARKGYARGVSDALRSCTGQWIFFSDADGQFSPSDFWKLWARRDLYDMIIGLKVRRRDDIYRIVLSSGFRRMVNILFRVKLQDSDSGFRLIRRQVMKSVVGDVRFLKYSFWIEFTIRAVLNGFRVCEIPISHHNREYGESRIFRASTIPEIVVKQLVGLARLFESVRRTN